MKNIIIYKERMSHGKWKVMQTVVIRTEGKPKYSEAYQCSVCGKWNNKKQNFCPNCGAKMDLEEQNNE